MCSGSNSINTTELKLSYAELATNEGTYIYKHIHYIAKKSRHTTKVIFTLLIGQIIALICVGIGKMSNEIKSKYNFNFPVLLNFAYYLVFGVIWMALNKGISKPKVYYFLIAIFDTQANLAKIKSFNDGQINYSIIINGSTILFSLLFTYILISKYKYRCFHIVGAFIAFTGVSLTLYGALNETNTDILNELINNKPNLIFALVSSILFSLSTVCMDKCFYKGSDVYDFFPWLGIVGAFLLILESFMFQEPQRFVDEWQWKGKAFVMKVFLFVLMVFIFGSVSPFYIRRATNSMFNVSLVSQIFWVYVVDCVINKRILKKDMFYYIGCAVMLGGIVMFGSFAVVKKKEHSLYEELKGMKEGIVPEEEGDTSTTNVVLRNIEKRNTIYKERQESDNKYI